MVQNKISSGGLGLGTVAGDGLDTASTKLAPHIVVHVIGSTTGRKNVISTYIYSSYENGPL